MLPRIFCYIHLGYKQIHRLRVAAPIFIVLAVVFVFTFGIGLEVFAQGSVDTFGVEVVDENVSLGSTDIRVIVARIIQVLLGLLGIVTVSLILYGGFLIMTSGGSEEKITQGKKTLINATIGLVIILSAFAIVQFILTALSQATGVTSPTGTARAPRIDSFNGSGALGRIVKDHYPFRDQTGIKRNSKVAVTFREAIDPISLIEDSNASGVYGDCVTPTGQVFDWAADCDRLRTSVVKIFPTDNPTELVEAAVLASFEGVDQEAFTFVFKPINLLGDSIEEVWYTAELTSDILKADGQSAFINDRDGRYFWEFRTDTTLDFDAPKIISVFPQAGTVAPRNTMVQIQFDEPVDPIVVQGILGGTSFSNMIFNSAGVTGEWRVSNGYTTVEFLSDQACGQNSCGDIMYCLPTGCSIDDEACIASYQSLVRTADLIAPGSFEALPFSGVMDMAGNGLDGNADDVADGKPSIGDATLIDAGEELPDNFLWNFSIQNTIDRTSPYIEQVFPGIDQEAVSGNIPVSIIFSKAMSASTLSDIFIQEYPANSDGLADLWYYIRSNASSTPSGSKTIAGVDHREFGPEGKDLYYFTGSPGTVKSLTQNCLYPGRGPVTDVKNTSPVCVYEEASDGSVITDQNCVGVNITSSTDTGCIQTNLTGDVVRGDVSACITHLESLSPITP